jgi:hypothetical protein
MPRLNIGLDRTLVAEHGPEVFWIWRTLLTGAGYSWCQVEPDAPDCDLAYVADPSRSRARLTIAADLDAWEHPAEQRLAGSTPAGSFPCLRFAGRAEGRELVHVGGRVICEGDPVFGGFWLCSGQGEPPRPRNRHGFFDLNGDPMAGLLRQAPVSAFATALTAQLTELGCPPPEPRWPGGMPAAACMSHDVDYPDPVRLLEPFRVLARTGRKGLPGAWAVAVGQRHHWHFGTIMDLEESLGLRSAFYFATTPGGLVQRALGTPNPLYDIRRPKFRRLFGELRSRGAEIGLHASYRACEAPGRIADEKRALEDAAEIPVVGNRHHYWRLNPADPDETLRFHELAGLVYDASLFHDRYVGWRRGATFPFFPFHRRLRRPLATLQIPTALMDDQLFGMKAHNPGDREAIVDELIARVLEQQGCLMVDVHEYVADPVLFPGWFATYRYLIDRLAASRRVWLATPAQVAEHWAKRARALAAESAGLGQAAFLPANPAAHAAL